MSPSLTLDRLVRKYPPVFQGTYDGKTLEVRLDSSAVIKLEGISDYDRWARSLSPPPAQIAEVASRLLEARHVEPISESIVVTISALDLD